MLVSNMTENAALDIVYRCLLEKNSILQQLRNREGLDTNQFNQLVDALEFLTDFYAEAEVVPKRLALCMVDLYTGFSFNDDFYNEPQATQIEDAGLLLQELATELFS